jgi:hypothetical protein
MQENFFFFPSTIFAVLTSKPEFNALYTVEKWAARSKRDSVVCDDDAGLD